MSTLNEAAIDAAKRAYGRQVLALPTKPNHKYPDLRSYADFHKASEFPSQDEFDSIWKAFREGSGIAYVCGAVSGNLAVLDIERDGKWLRDKMEAELPAELWAKLTTWEETSPGGYHLYFRLPYNMAKVRFTDEEGNLIAELLAQGCIVVAAPTRGYHEKDQPTKGYLAGMPYEYNFVSGGPEALVTLTESEADELFKFLSTYREAKKERDEVSTLAADGGEDGYLDWVKAQVDQRFSWDAILLEAGCRKVRTDAFGKTYYEIPGGGAHEWGLCINPHSNRMSCWAASLEQFSDVNSQRTTYNKLEALAGFDPVYRSTDVAAVTAKAKELYPVSKWLRRGCPHLPESFWTERPYLTHIKEAALAGEVAPDAVFGAVLSLVSYKIDYRLLLPGLVGTYAPPNLFTILAGSSSAGKSVAHAVARDLIGTKHPFDEDAKMTGVGSGEGIAASFYGKVRKRPDLEETLKHAGVEVEPDIFGDPDDEPITIKTKVKEQSQLEQVRHHVYYSVDEGQMLYKLANRQGSILAEVLRSAWSGTALGSNNADKAKNFPVGERSYRFAMSMGVQPENARELIDDAIGGTPQRFVWFSFAESNVPDYSEDEPDLERPEMLKVKPMPWSAAPQHVELEQGSYGVFGYDPVIKHALKSRRRRQRQNQDEASDADPLLAHASQNQLRVAGVLAYMDGRLHITQDDWRLADLVLENSTGVLRWVQRQISAGKAKQEKAAEIRYASKAAAAKRAELQVEVEAASDVDRIARGIARYVHKRNGATERDALKSTKSGNDRKLAPKALQRAIDLQMVVLSEGELKPGSLKPA